MNSILNIYILVISFVLCNSLSFSQSLSYNALNLPENLTDNANAVIQSYDVKIGLQAIDKMVTTHKRVTTVLNKEGNRHVDAHVFYDDVTKVKSLSATAYDASGNVIKKFKKKDFKDVSAVSGGTLYSDSRVLYLEYTPVNYPYTIKVNYETQTENTAFIPPFTPVRSYYLSCLNSSFSIENNSGVNIRMKEFNLDGYEVEKSISNSNIKYQISNQESYVYESYSPEISSLIPKVIFAADEFVLEGVRGSFSDWNSFGQWMEKDLLTGQQELSPATISIMRELVKDETTDIGKAKKIYQFVQDKVRYISVQVGIGGWKPFAANTVDELGYSDCKGLTNYTKALLEAVGVNSEYTVVYAGKEKKNIDGDFASIQGNHVILSIPLEKDRIWLECTSQKLPFGFIGDFTDDRNVLVVSKDGGRIIKTKKYKSEDSQQITSTNAEIFENGSLLVETNFKSTGIQYDDKYYIETKTEKELDTYYKERWDYLNDIQITKMNINNNKDKIEFNEKIELNVNNYANQAGERLLVNINPINRITNIPDRYRNRKNPLQILRGFKDVDEVEFKINGNLNIESLPEQTDIVNKFGQYKVEIIKKDNNTFLYKRLFKVNDGLFAKEDYKSFRAFYKKVAKLDNAKFVLIKS